MAIVVTSSRALSKGQSFIHAFNHSVIHHYKKKGGTKTLSQMLMPPCSSRMCSQSLINLHCRAEMNYSF